MQEKELKASDIDPHGPEDVWFECKCGIKYNDHLEEVIPPEEIRGTIEWANTPTTDKNYIDAITKFKIREKHEN